VSVFIRIQPRRTSCIERVDSKDFCLGQFEVENVQILSLALRARGRGRGRDSLLSVPSQNDLARRLAVPCGRHGYGRLIKERTAPAEWAVGTSDNVILSMKRLDVGTHVFRIELDLVDMRCKTDFEEPLQVGGLEV
jgi:hypothetical protein